MMKKIKTSWNDVTLREFIEIGKIEGDKELANLPINKSVKLIVAVSDYTEEEVMNMSGPEFSELVEAASFLQTDGIDEVESQFIGDVEYVQVNNNTLSAGEMISIEQYLMTGAETDTNTIPHQLAVLVRPKGEKFDPAILDARAELFLDHLKVPFFIGLLTDSLSTGVV